MLLVQIEAQELFFVCHAKPPKNLITLSPAIIRLPFLKFKFFRKHFEIVSYLNIARIIEIRGMPYFLYPSNAFRLWEIVTFRSSSVKDSIKSTSYFMI